MSHQDWKPVILSKDTKKKKKEIQTKISKRGPSKLTKIDNETENFKIEKVSLKFKKELQKARLAKKMTQKELATKLNVPPKVINEYEAGKAIPNVQLILKMDKVLGVKLPRK